MSGIHAFDRDGWPINFERFCELLGRLDDYKRVAFTTVGAYEVSTVWLGIDHSFGFNPEPLIFETMVFPDCDLCERYSTEAAARQGHDDMVTLLRATQPEATTPNEAPRE